MQYDREILERQFPVVEFFVKYLAYHRGLKAAWDGASNPSEFWSLTIGGHLELAAMAWCKVFGSYGEDIHWTKTPTGRTAQEAIQDFRGRILCRTGFTPEEWKNYQARVLDIRDKFCAHLDLHKPVIGHIPSFDPALQVAYAYEEWVKAYLMKGAATSNPSSLRSLYRDRKTDATSIMSRQTWR